MTLDLIRHSEDDQDRLGRFWTHARLILQYANFPLSLS
jgi:hypothetical protein